MQQVFLRNNCVRLQMTHDSVILPKLRHLRETNYVLRHFFLCNNKVLIFEKRQSKTSSTNSTPKNLRVEAKRSSISSTSSIGTCSRETTKSRQLCWNASSSFNLTESFFNSDNNFNPLTYRGSGTISNHRWSRNIIRIYIWLSYCLQLFK